MMISTLNVGDSVSWSMFRSTFFILYVRFFVIYLIAVCSLCLPSRRSVFDMFNFLASKHRQPPEYRPQEEDDDEGQLRTARSVGPTVDAIVINGSQ